MPSVTTTVTALITATPPLPLLPPRQISFRTSTAYSTYASSRAPITAGGPFPSTSTSLPTSTPPPFPSPPLGAIIGGSVSALALILLAALLSTLFYRRRRKRLLETQRAASSHLSAEERALGHVRAEVRQVQAIPSDRSGVDSAVWEARTVRTLRREVGPSKERVVPGDMKGGLKRERYLRPMLEEMEGEVGSVSEREQEWAREVMERKRMLRREREGERSLSPAASSVPVSTSTVTSKISPTTTAPPCKGGGYQRPRCVEEDELTSRKRQLRFEEEASRSLSPTSTVKTVPPMTSSPSMKKDKFLDMAPFLPSSQIQLAARRLAAAQAAAGPISPEEIARDEVSRVLNRAHTVIPVAAAASTREFSDPFDALAYRGPDALHRNRDQNRHGRHASDGNDGAVLQGRERHVDADHTRGRNHPRHARHVSDNGPSVQGLRGSATDTTGDGETLRRGGQLYGENGGGDDEKNDEEEEPRLRPHGDSISPTPEKRVGSRGGSRRTVGFVAAEGEAVRDDDGGPPPSSPTISSTGRSETTLTPSWTSFDRNIASRAGEGRRTSTTSSSMRTRGRRSVTDDEARQIAFAEIRQAEEALLYGAQRRQNAPHRQGDQEVSPSMISSSIISSNAYDAGSRLQGYSYGDDRNPDERHPAGHCASSQ